ncbi:MAG: hypothetical protein ACO210_04245 [Sediminibacterium sp.]
MKPLLFLMVIALSSIHMANGQVVISGRHANFFREGDKSFITAKIVNKSNKPVTGQVHLSLINPSNNSPVDGWFQNVFPSQFYSIDAGTETRIQFPIQAAFGYMQLLRYQLEATVLENKKEVISTSTYTDSFFVHTNRILVSDSVVLKTINDTTLKGIFSALLNAPESSTHNNMRISFTASSPLDYWKLQMGNKQFTSAGRTRFDTLLLSDFITNEMGNYTLQTNHSVPKNNSETKIIWTHYNKIEKPIKSNKSFGLQKIIQQKINGRWVVLPENATLHVGDTIKVTVYISTPRAFTKIALEENIMGGGTLLLPQNSAAKKYASYFTQEIDANRLAKQVINYHYILTSVGVFSMGNTFVHVKTNTSKQSPIKLFIPATELRVEE